MLGLILLATILVSLLSLIGVCSLSIHSRVLKRALIYFVGFAAGGLMGGAFLHLLPEALRHAESSFVMTAFLGGFSFFFLSERYFYWRHCHKGQCDVDAFTYLNLFGDGLHNFIDGLIIAASFATDIKLGWITTLAVAMHEIPQEIGDFGILVYGGFRVRKALLWNFLCALAAVAGAVTGYLIAGITPDYIRVLLPFTAGGFAYIAAADLIPEFRTESVRRSTISFVLFLAGVLFMALVKMIG
ncbi:MAG: ZIP family metal transporter [Candidatus Omnitrophica bacterium]|nr:ZIP family metal transporter [Candidatus Omnitrophota bacterium]